MWRLLVISYHCPIVNKFNLLTSRCAPSSKTPPLQPYSRRGSKMKRHPKNTLKEYKDRDIFWLVRRLYVRMSERYGWLNYTFNQRCVWLVRWLYTSIREIYLTRSLVLQTNEWHSQDFSCVVHWSCLYSLVQDKFWQISQMIAPLCMSYK